MESFFAAPDEGPRVMNPGAALFRHVVASGANGLIVKAGQEQTNGAYSIFEATMPGNAAMVNPHIHRYEEGWYVVEGTLRFVIGESEYFAEPGSYVLAPRGSVHSYGNATSLPAKYLIVFSPAQDALWRGLTDLRTAAGEGDLDWEAARKLYEESGEEPGPELLRRLSQGRA